MKVWGSHGYPTQNPFKTRQTPEGASFGRSSKISPTQECLGKSSPTLNLTTKSNKSMLKKNIQSGHDWTNRKGWLFNWKLMIVYMIVSMDWTIFLNQFGHYSSTLELPMMKKRSQVTSPHRSNRQEAAGWPQKKKFTLHQVDGIQLPSLKLTVRPWKWPPGKGDSYWKPSFLGAMLVLGRVIVATPQIGSFPRGRGGNQD